MAVIQGQSVAVAESEVSILVPDSAVAVSGALVVHSDPVRTV